MVRREIMDVWSSNLRLLAHGTTDEELERAIRSGITPQSTSDWLMPSMDYSYMSEDDATAIVSYLRTLAAQGEPAPRTEFSIPVRFAIAEGDIEPVASEVLESSASLDLGSRYDGGRYLARIGCSDCHGTDLSGSSAVPDLIDVAGYSRAQFFALLHAGRASNGRQLAIMSRPRFRAFYDYEIDALYDYLSARAKALSPRGTLSSPARGEGARYVSSATEGAIALDQLQFALRVYVKIPHIRQMARDRGGGGHGGLTRCVRPPRP